MLKQKTVFYLHSDYSKLHKITLQCSLESWLFKVKLCHWPQLFSRYLKNTMALYNEGIYVKVFQVILLT